MLFENLKIGRVTIHEVFKRGSDRRRIDPVCADVIESLSPATIPADLPCELQARTLLQHAYSELTHDTIYKPSVQSTPSLKRAAAKSMALIEATSDYFSAVSKEIEQSVALSKSISDILDIKYSEWISEAPVCGPLHSLIVDHYSKLISGDLGYELDEWWKSKSFLLEVIIKRGKEMVLYRTSAILLIYYCVSKFRFAAQIDSPLSDDDLSPIYSDLGFAMSGMQS